MKNLIIFIFFYPNQIIFIFTIKNFSSRCFFYKTSIFRVMREVHNNSQKFSIFLYLHKGFALKLHNFCIKFRAPSLAHCSYCKAVPTVLAKPKLQLLYQGCPMQQVPAERRAMKAMVSVRGRKMQSGTGRRRRGKLFMCRGQRDSDRQYLTSPPSHGTPPDQQAKSRN